MLVFLCSAKGTLQFHKQSYKESFHYLPKKPTTGVCRLDVSSFPEEGALEGTTLAVYVFAVRFNRPIGTRDVVRGLGLSSPSVAYRHLQKLVATGLLTQNESGEYTVKTKRRIHGYLWLGHHLVPQVTVYSFLFMVFLAVEAIVFVIHFGVENYEFKVFFFILMLITAAVVVLLLVEGFLQLKRFNRTEYKPKKNNNSNNQAVFGFSLTPLKQFVATF